MASIKSDIRALNALSAAMRDIVIDKKVDSIFFEYEDKGIIGRKIFEAIMQKRRESEDGKTIIFSDTIKQPGLLATVQILQTILLLINDYNIELTDEVCQVSKELLKDMIARIENPNGDYRLFVTEGVPQKDIPEGNFLFDASPYDVVFPACFSYIDSMSWVLPVALDFLRTNCLNGYKFFGPNTEGKLKALAKFCVKYLNLAFVANPRNSRMTCGWNFTWKCVNPSLYYTYAVGECCQSVKSNYFDYVDGNDGSALVDTDSGRKFAQLLAEINDDLPYNDPTSPVGRLLGNLLRAADGIWNETKEHIDDRFFNYDLSVVDDDTIRHSQSSDVLFNMVFIVNTIISSGLNDSIDEKIQSAKDDAEREKYQKERNDMFELIQLAMQRTSRFYNELKAAGKDYIVDQYYAVFNEDYVYHKVLAKELRKRRIRMMSLLPVIISTITLLGEYLVKYPQIDMIKYLDSLMNDRIVDERGKFMWLWEKDCYYTTSTFYYTSSLGGFYRYYEAYEERFSRIDTENNEYKARIRDEQYRNLTAEGGEIFRLQQQVAQLQEENARQAAIIAQGSPVENAITELCRHSLRDTLLEAINEVIGDIVVSMDPCEERRLGKEEKVFVENVKLLVVRALFDKKAYEMAGDCKEALDARNQKEAYGKLINFVRKDIRNAVQYYTKQVVVSVKHESDFVMTEGYDGIRTALTRKKD